MLKDFQVTPNIPITDVKKSKEFYVDKLGLELLEETEYFLILGAGNGTKIMCYVRGETKTEHTHASFEVKDIYNVVKDLKEKGVKFESYDTEYLKTDENNVAQTMPDENSKGAWFKDPDGNILALFQN